MSFKQDIERAQVPDPGRKSYVYDDEVKGLAVRVTSTGHRSYVVRILNRNTGKHEYKKIADVGAIELKMAREIARIELGKLQMTVSLGLNPAEERKKQVAQRITLRQALEKYISDKSNTKMQRHLSEAAQRDYKSCITNHLKPFLDKSVRSLTKEDFFRVYSRLGQAKPRTALKLGRYTRAVLNHINKEYDRTLFAHNPVSLAIEGRLYEDVRKETVVEPERLKEFFERLESLEIDDQDFIKVALFSGLRAGAIRTLKWENLDLQNHVMHVYEAAIYKGTRPLPLSSYLRALLELRRERYPDAEWVFEGRKGENLVEHKKIFQRLKFPVADGDEKLITAHDLRRTFATTAALAGLSESLIADLLLHRKSGNVTRGYIITQVQFLRAPAEKIASQILQYAGKDALIREQKESLDAANSR